MPNSKGGTVLTAVIGAVATIVASLVGATVGKDRGRKEVKDETDRQFIVQAFSRDDHNRGLAGARIDLGGSDLNPQYTDNLGTAVFVLPEQKLGRQGSLTVEMDGFERLVNSNVVLRPTKPLPYTVYLDRITKASQETAQPITLVYSSGPKPSGSGKDFSDWYTLCSGSPPHQGFKIGHAEFVLSGDRKCNAWSECQLSNQTDIQVCWKFRLQGHDEWPPPGQGISEGQLSVVWQK